MKKFLKRYLPKNSLIVVVIFLFAALVRFYNFPNRVTFWSEQARSLIVSAEYLKKPSLLGQEYFRVDSNGHILYSGAIFNYSLVPLLLVSNYDPLRITVFFSLLNLFTGFIIYWVLKKLFNFKLAIISVALFLFNDFMIYHSLFIWNYNYLPLIGILSFYFLVRQWRKQTFRNLFILGLLSGLGVSLQFLYLLIAIPVLILSVWKSKKKFAGFLFFILGASIGNLPMLIFDLRHNFYHIRSLTQYLFDTLRGRSDAGFSYYYLLPFWPVFAIALGYITSKFYRYNKLLAFIIIAAYLYFNLTSPRVSFTAPTGMPEGLNVKDVDNASRMIAQDIKGQFNVAEVLDFDKRAYTLRYYLQYVYSRIPEGVTEYPDTKVLYVLADRNYNFQRSNVWEITSGGDYRPSQLGMVGNGYAVYKLLHELK